VTFKSATEAKDVRRVLLQLRACGVRVVWRW